MAVVEKHMLAEMRIIECGHLFKCWTERFADGTWELHFHAECEVGESIATEIRAKMFPEVRLRKAL